LTSASRVVILNPTIIRPIHSNWDDTYAHECLSSATGYETIWRPFP
jgi:hypothetical protein